jgi:hypothetical protein
VELHHSILDDLLQEVVTDIDVFGAIVELWVLGNCNGRLVVDVKDGGGWGVEAKFRKKLPQPYGFLGSVGSRDVLYLCTRQSNGCLFLRALAHSGICQLECIARCRLVVIDIAGPVCVGISEQHQTAWGTSFKDELLVPGGPKVPKDLLKSMLVIRARVGGMLSKGCDGIAEVRTCP